jgi:GH25 family lysozyme M1 (1,4-beta-N-acetylmuramidase)
MFRYRFEGAIILVATILSPSLPSAQDLAIDDDLNPASFRRLSDPEAGPQAAAPYFLTPEQRAQYGGTFGVDLSHYSFDIGNGASTCKTQAGYANPACSCTINWQNLTDNGLLFVYSKASDGEGIDLSFRRVWSELESRHAAKTTFRGAYHFLRPDVDADKQADVFLRQVGAVNGQKPTQLPPVLDIEWSNKKVNGSESFYSVCKAKNRITTIGSTEYCDMWFQKQSLEIAAMARKWIDRVEQATGRPILIYTNPTGWWNSMMTPAEDTILLNSRAVWTSRYTSAGPDYNPNWTDHTGGAHWKMAPLPRGASYPPNAYTVAHFWQFTESGRLPQRAFTCAGHGESRPLDLNWLPVSAAETRALFGVGN